LSSHPLFPFTPAMEWTPAMVKIFEEEAFAALREIMAEALL
jgi:hypothetical protein